MQTLVSHFGGHAKGNNVVVTLRQASAQNRLLGMSQFTQALDFGSSLLLFLAGPLVLNRLPLCSSSEAANCD